MKASPGTTASGNSAASGRAHAERGPNHSDSAENHDVPRWRQIEIMRERAELRKALDDIDFEEDDYEEEVFGSEEENESLYFHGDAPPEEEVELDEDDLESDEFEDFEED